MCYGNLTPKTQSGKVVTMLYALFGVPLMLMCLSNLGSLLAGTFQFAYSHKCCSSCGHQGNHRSNAQKQQHHCLYDKQRTPSCSQYQRRPSRAPSYSSCQQQNKNDSIPPPPLVTCTINPRGSGRLIQARPRPRPLTPEVRKLLTECAEYTLAQESPSPDPGATRILRELKDPEAGVVAEEDEGQDEEEDVEADDRDDGDIEHWCASATIHDTPSRVPLIYRPHVEPHLHKRPPTPPPRHSRPDSNSSDQNTEDQQKVQVPVTIVLLVLVLYICLGAIVFSAWEGWTFLDGAYFCFVTLSTIGFGDMVPGKSLKSTDTQHGQLQLVACCAYLLLGLVLIAMSFTLVQEEVLVKCRQVAYFVGILKKVEPH
uniref:Potassium channel domain-containing protein n=1 Tax=Timema douglasi TaxID=61478 RepID=A0A7R8VT88_TIMDO|nr:unnamed protein product [Timema douglasi]